MNGWDHDLRVSHQDENGCASHRSCDDQLINPLFNDLPGGIRTRAWGGGSFCTNGPRFMNGGEHTYDYGWSIAAHCLPFCSSDSNNVEHDDNSMPTPLRHYGQVVLVDRSLDIAYVEPAGTSPDPLSEIVHPADHSDSIHISGTVAESSMGTIQNNPTYPIDIRGVYHCETSGGNLRYIDMTINNTDPNYNCVDNWDSQFVVETGIDHTRPGDSGAVPYVEGPEGNYFALGSLTAGTCNSSGNIYTGGQGYSIRDEHNIWWDDL